MFHIGRGNVDVYIESCGFRAPQFYHLFLRSKGIENSGITHSMGINER